jgi:hypothetical protein
MSWGERLPVRRRLIPAPPAEPTTAQQNKNNDEKWGEIHMLLGVPDQLHRAYLHGALFREGIPTAVNVRSSQHRVSLAPAAVRRPQAHCRRFRYPARCQTPLTSSPLVEEAIRAGWTRRRSRGFGDELAIENRKDA